MSRRVFISLCVGLLSLAFLPPLWAQPSASAVNAFQAYARATESRLARQHQSQDAFLVFSSGEQARVRGGEVIIEQLTSESNAEIAGSLLHHWRGTAFVPGATAAAFERPMQDYASYPRYFAPQVLRAKLLSRNGDRVEASMRVRQHHGITVVMDTDYDITYGRLDAQHGYSISRSTKIAEIASAGTNEEHALSSGEAHGFLWRLNTYWSYEERDGGLYLQIETISLTRSIPAGLKWIIGPYVESIPRESMEFTLRAACNALRQQTT
jgi:hypothetical protein